MKRLPPLKSLRAFEAAARHLSLSKAAEELFVTPGAISQQVKLLEQFLSVQLFERRHRQIVLTDAGKMLHPGISAAFDQILVSLSTVEKFDQSRPLTVSSAPSFASKWLVPRLHRFNRKHQDIDVRFDTSTDLVDLIHGDIEVGIRFGSGKYPDLVADFLMCQEVYPVCSPDMIDPAHPLKTPADLVHYPLLHYDYPQNDTSWPDWQMWLAAAGVNNVPFNRGPRFVQVDMLMAATTNGHGVALAGSVSAEDDIRSGRLIKVFNLTFPLSFSYYIVCHESRLADPRVKAFRQWLLDDISDEHKRTSGRTD